MTGIIVGMFNAIKGFLGSVLPTMSSSGTANITSAIGYFVQFIGLGNYFFPVTTLFAVMGLMMAYRLALFLWFCVNWVLRFIP
jgi:hypothetical protein